jgi:hypothetical protein
VKPGFQTVLLLVAELIRNEDGKKKQDCERETAKRWLKGNAKRYKRLNPVFFGGFIAENDEPDG